MKTKKYKGFSYEDGRIVKSAYIDAYAFGDTMMEGVFFKITVLEDGTLKAESSKKSKEYMKQFNEEYWIKEALRYAERTDFFFSKHGGGEDLELEEI